MMSVCFICSFTRTEFFVKLIVNLLRLTCRSTPIRYCGSEPTSHYSYSVMLRAKRRSNKYQFYNLWFDPTRDRTHHLGIRDEHATHYTTNAVYFELRRLDNKTMINIEMCNKCLCDNDPQAYRTVQSIILKSPYGLQKWTSVSTALKMIFFSQKRVSRMIRMILGA